MPRESLASQDTEDSEKTSFHANASMLTRAAHASLFVCAKEGMGENRPEREAVGRGRGDLEGFHISLGQQFTHVTTH